VCVRVSAGAEMFKFQSTCRRLTSCRPRKYHENSSNSWAIAPTVV